MTLATRDRLAPHDRQKLPLSACVPHLGQYIPASDSTQAMLLILIAGDKRQLKPAALIGEQISSFSDGYSEPGVEVDTFAKHLVI